MISIYEYLLKNNIFMEADAPPPPAGDAGAPPPAGGAGAPPPPAGGDLGGGLGGAIGGGAPPPPDLGGGLGAPDASLGGAVAGGGAPTDIVTKLDVYNWDSILQNYFNKKDKESKDKKEKSIVKRLSSQFF